MRRIIVSVALLVLLMGGWLLTRQTPLEPEGFTVGDALSGIPMEGFKRASEARTFRFPEDHGAHSGFRNEWWYFTGNLHTAQGRRFGFQLVFFRNAISPGAAAGESPWRSHHTWMAHFALTDVQSSRFYAFERFSREAIELAGAQTSPLAIWLDDWSLREQDDHWRLHAADDGLALDLKLKPLRPPLLQGDAGLSRKSAEPGNASYYYSIPRLQAEGRILAQGQSHQVSGLSWLDREWSTSALSVEQKGWDWFSLQLDDGSDLMFYRLRRKDGSTDSFSAGSWRQADGTLIRLSAEQVQLTPLAWWSSPRGGRYPIRWRLQIPAQAIDLQVSPVIRQQELDLLIRYWEGAVNITGRHGQQPVQGMGYMELTGYGG